MKNGGQLQIDGYKYPEAEVVGSSDSLCCSSCRLSDSITNARPGLTPARRLALGDVTTRARPGPSSAESEPQLNRNRAHTTNKLLSALQPSNPDWY